MVESFQALIAEKSRRCLIEQVWTVILRMAHCINSELISFTFMEQTHVMCCNDKLCEKID